MHKTKEFIVTLTIHFDIEATSLEAATEMAHNEYPEWLRQRGLALNARDIKVTLKQKFCTSCGYVEAQNGDTCSYCSRSLNGII